MTAHNRARSERVELVREPVPGSCPACGEEDLARYPVNSEGGWFMVVKCQACLYSVSRDKWSLLGPITLLADEVEGARR
jgi:vanillate/4-hydroxybenzoate decarboxylase subunit D